MRRDVLVIGNTGLTRPRGLGGSLVPVAVICRTFKIYF